MGAYKKGGYMQITKEFKGEIVDVTCTCKWSTIHPDAWEKGTNLCKHIKEVIKWYKKQA